MGDLDRLPCPFCGHTLTTIVRGHHEPDADIRSDDPEKWDWWCFCASCTARGPWNNTSREIAVRDWNRRPVLR